MTSFTFSQHLYGIYKVHQWGLKCMVPRNVKATKICLPKTAESLNKKFTMGFSWQGELQWNNG